MDPMFSRYLHRAFWAGGHLAALLRRGPQPVLVLPHPVAVAQDVDDVEWCSSRSMSAAAMTSSPSALPHSSKPVLKVSTVDARSWLALMSWKKGTAPSWVTDR